MNYGFSAKEAVGMENRGNVVREPAFRYERPLMGGEWLVRDAGPQPAAPEFTARSTAIRISWPRDVAWSKRVRYGETF